MFGDFPPSSTLTRLIESAAERSTSRPTDEEPVNDTLSTPGCATSAAPARAPPVTTCSTPAGLDEQEVGNVTTGDEPLLAVEQPASVGRCWGGFKQSGIGRELGAHGSEDYLESKHIYLNHAR